MIRVLLVDDHHMVREGLATVLTVDGDIEVVGEASTADQAFSAVERFGPDIVLMDVRLSGGDGIEACETIRARYPATRVIVLTGLGSERVMVRAFEAGANGFVLKESPPDVLRVAVRTVATGGTFVDPQVAGRLVSAATTRRVKGPHGLTRQEMRVIEYLPKGMTNREIGREMGLSPETVKTHMSNAMHKLQVADRTQLAAIAAREGLV